MIEYPGPPSAWIVRGGKPADCLGDCRKRSGGMPSYEHEDQNGLVVYDFLIAAGEAHGSMMLTSTWYGIAALVSPEETVPLHHTPGAWWVWRPMLYRRSIHGRWDCLGSQEELAWRYGLNQVQFARARIEDGDYDIDRDFTMAKADAKAKELLLENLTPQQAIEYHASNGGEFCCRGGATKNLYKIDIGAGFYILSKLTREEAVSYCWHTEYWIPHDDVALATKLQLEDPELEEQVLVEGRPTMLPGPVERAQPWAKIAMKMEAELL